MSIAAAALAGCVVGPSYRAPTIALQPYHGGAALAARGNQPAAPPLDRWWTGFHDDELTHIVERALQQNLDLAASLARVRQARAMAHEAGAALLPEGEFSAQIAGEHQSLDSPIGTLARHAPDYERDQTLRDVGVGASWEIDLFGGLRRATQAADAEAQAAEADHLGVRVSVAAEAADAYLQIRGDQMRLEVAQSQIKTDAHLLELVRLRLAEGAATDRELAQSEALLARARATLPPLALALERQLNRLDVLLGSQPGTYASELATLADIPGTPAISGAQDPSQLLRRRPDVSAAERRLAAANARIGVAVAQYYPKISVSGLLGFESLQADRLFSSETFQPLGAAGLRWRLFDFGKIDSEVANADAATAEALAHYRQSVLRAAEDVENSFAALVQLENETHELSSEVAALTKARDAAQAAYLGGAVDLIDVLDADRQLLVARDELTRTRADTARAAVGSFRALGGGW